MSKLFENLINNVKVIYDKDNFAYLKSDDVESFIKTESPITVELIRLKDCCNTFTTSIDGYRETIARLRANSIPISKLEEVISDLNIGSKEIYSKPIVYRLQKLIDKAKQ